MQKIRRMKSEPRMFIKESSNFLLRKVAFEIFIFHYLLNVIDKFNTFGNNIAKYCKYIVNMLTILAKKLVIVKYYFWSELKDAFGLKITFCLKHFIHQ